MLRFLPFIIIPVLILGGLAYWRYSTTSSVTKLEQQQQVSTDASIEVPKTLPNASLEDRVKALEEINSKLVTQINALKTPGSSAPAVNLEPRLTDAESTITELKARISALEKPASSVSVSKAPLYIPLGASGGPWLYADWTSLNEYQVSVNPDNYSGYTGMQLEVNFRLVGAPGTGYVRLYNATDRSAIVSEISTTNTSFGVLASSVFKLTSGQKLYTIQVKSTNSQDLYIQSVRIKVNF